MKRWKPEEKPALPVNDLEFLELETCKAFHYAGYRAWKEEAPQVRARLMAHELEKNAREGYEFEARMKKAKTRSDHERPRQEEGGVNLFSQMKANWGLR